MDLELCGLLKTGFRDGKKLTRLFYGAFNHQYQNYELLDLFNRATLADNFIGCILGRGDLLAIDDIWALHARGPHPKALEKNGSREIVRNVLWRGTQPVEFVPHYSKRKALRELNDLKSNSLTI